MKYWLFAVVTIFLLIFSCGGGEKSPPPFETHSYWPRALKEAQASGKPVLLVFDWKGSSVDCFEPLRDPEISEKIKSNYVVVGGWVDDDTPVPEEFQFESPAGKKVRTVGRFFYDAQKTFMPEFYQPMYAVFSNTGTPFLVNGKPLYTGYFSQGNEDEKRFFLNMLDVGIRKSGKDSL